MKEIERKKRQERIREMISCSGKPHISRAYKASEQRICSGMEISGISLLLRNLIMSSFGLR